MSEEIHRIAEYLTKSIFKDVNKKYKVSVVSVKKVFNDKLVEINGLKRQLETLGQVNNAAQQLINNQQSELKAAKEEIERLKGNINKMFLELGSKWHDNEVTISNPSLFLNSWKREILNK